MIVVVMRTRELNLLSSTLDPPGGVGMQDTALKNRNLLLLAEFLYTSDLIVTTSLIYGCSPPKTLLPSPF